MDQFPTDDELRKALLYPDSVALIGASASEARLTSRPQRFCAKHGFAGEKVKRGKGIKDMDSPVKLENDRWKRDYFPRSGRGQALLRSSQ